MLFIAGGLVLYGGLELLHPPEGLGNNDVAGIAYEADIIASGGLPYRDTVELKSPAPFFLVAGAWAVLGRSAWVLHLACHLWILLGAVGMAFGTWWLESGEGSRTSPALRLRLMGASVGLYLAASAPFGSNYTQWMMPAYAWAFALAVVGLRTGRLRWHVAAGFASTLAFLGKTHAVMLAAAIPAAWIWVRWRGGPRRTSLANDWAWMAWVLGAALGALPLITLYAAHGALPALIDGVLPFGKASEYGARDIHATPVGVVLGVIDHQWDVLPMLLLASAGVAALCVLTWALRADEAPVTALPEGDPSSTDALDPPARSRGHEAPVEVRLEWVLVAFWVLSLVGGGLGGLRYYGHYASQYIPAMVWLACSARPWRALARPSPGRRPLMLALIAVIAVTTFVGGSRVYLAATGAVKNDYHPGPAAEEAGAYIAARSRDDERIQVFGWRAWPVYFWAERRAPGRLYKVLGAITEYNRNGRFEPPKSKRDPNLRFKPGPLADELLNVFREAPPAFAVRTIPFFPGAKNDPIRDFLALERLLRRDYVFSRRFGRIYVYERRAHRDARRALEGAAGDGDHDAPASAVLDDDDVDAPR
jgi:hypothetical protein